MNKETADNGQEITAVGAPNSKARELSKHFGFEKIGPTNYHLTVSEDCFVSYNSSNAINMAGSPETAVVFGSGKGCRFYILNGDYRIHFSNCKTPEEVKSKALELTEEPHAFWTNDWNGLKDELTA